MCQYCANTGLCYFIISYGGLWIYWKLRGIRKHAIKNRGIKTGKRNSQGSRDQSNDAYRLKAGSGHYRVMAIKETLHLLRKGEKAHETN